MLTKAELRAALVARHGEAMQNKFDGASVAICGLGGLGSNIAIALARAGVRRLHLIDFDRVELSNLNRQQYFVQQLGQYKADALRENLRGIAPYCELVTETLRVTEENVPGLFDEDDLICEAFDKAENKAMLVSAVLEHYPQKYLVAGSGMAGLSSANEIRTRRVAPKFYLCGDGEHDVAAGLGLFGARVLVCAAHQATMILRLLAGEEEA